MNTYTRIIFLTGALALTVASACESAFGAPRLPVNPGLTNAMTPAMPAHRELTLAMLGDRLRDTKAINPFRKLELKSEVDDLLAQFRVAQATGKPEVDALRPSYDELVGKIQALLKKDRKLARDINVSKEAIWVALADRTQYASLR